jgi:hypothetical protein
MRGLVWTVGALALWILCVVYWAALADCLEGKECSEPHVLLNQITFAGIFLIPVVLLMAWIVAAVRRRG